MGVILSDNYRHKNYTAEALNLTTERFQKS